MIGFLTMATSFKFLTSTPKVLKIIAELPSKRAQTAILLHTFRVQPTATHLHNLGKGSLTRPVGTIRDH